MSSGDDDLDESVGAPLRRALPGPMIDLIRDGVARDELRARGNGAVWSALLRTACSAAQRGHAFAEWVALLDQHKSQLGVQAATKKGRDLPVERVHETYRAAWDAALDWLERKPPPFDRDAAKKRAQLVHDWAADPATPLPANPRAVLVYATQVAERNGTTRPALPRRTVAKETGLGVRAAVTALDWLVKRRLLNLAQRGRPGGPAAQQRKANLYNLPTDEDCNAYLCRETRPVAPTRQVYGTPEVPAVGTLRQIYGTPRAPRGSTPRAFSRLCPESCGPGRRRDSA